MSKEFRQIGWDATIEDDLRQLVRLAVREDLDRFQDWTTVALVESDRQGSAAVVMRQAGRVAGLLAAPVLLDEMEASVKWQALAVDGDYVGAGQELALLSGSARDLLTCERPLLNLLGHLSGIATLTHHYVEQVKGTGAQIYDTRKTTPGWRRLEKYAVRCGGGSNHRTGLFDAVLIKDNHLALAAGEGSSPEEAVRKVRDFLPGMLPKLEATHMVVEIEVDRLEMLQKVLSAEPDIVLLDNMSCDMLRQAVAMRDEAKSGEAKIDVQLEASGCVTLETVRSIAETGVDRISVGTLTHSAPTLDIGLDWRDEESLGS